MNKSTINLDENVNLGFIYATKRQLLTEALPILEELEEQYGATYKSILFTEFLTHILEEEGGRK